MLTKDQLAQMRATGSIKHSQIAGAGPAVRIANTAVRQLVACLDEIDRLNDEVARLAK